MIILNFENLNYNKESSYIKERGLPTAVHISAMIAS